MAGKQAKILTNDQVASLLDFATFQTRWPVRNRLMVLLSVKAGLRAGEISKLRWDMIVDGSGAIGPTIELPDSAAKKGSGLRIPLHKDLRSAFSLWLELTQPTGPVI